MRHSVWDPDGAQLLANTLVSMAVTPLGIATFVRLVQVKNAEYPMLTTPLRIVQVGRLVHHVKTRFGRLVRLVD